MKKIVLASLLLSFNFLTFCQNKNPSATTTPAKDSLPKYAKDKVLPNFKIVVDVRLKDASRKLLDTTLFTNANLPVNRPVVIVYFSPECGHCHFEMKEIIKNIDSLRNAFFVFTSRYPIDSIKGFANKYKVSSYPNMIMGKDPTYFFPVYYNISFTPFIAVYDTNKNFVKAYPEGANMHELISLVNTPPAENVIEKKSKKKHTAN